MKRPLACIAVAALLRADAAWCQDGKGVGELERWVPSAGVAIGAIRQSGKGTQVNNVRPRDDDLPPPGPFPGQTFEGDDYLLDPFATFTAELMTPQLPVAGSIPGRPRLFVHGEVGGAAGSGVPLAEEGSPGEFTLPPPPPLPPPPIPAPDPLTGVSVGGQGTRTEYEIENLVASVGGGIAFTADLFDRRFRVKPSFEYLRVGVTARGILRHVTGNWPPGDPTNNYNFITMSPQESRTLNYVGGGLELEMDTVRLGPFVIAVFANGQAYQLLDDREIALSDTDPANGIVANWDVKLDRAAYRGAAGLRFRFVPAED